MHFYYGQLVDKVSSFYLLVGSKVAENACQKSLLPIRVLKRGVQAGVVPFLVGEGMGAWL